MVLGLRIQLYTFSCIGVKLFQSSYSGTLCEASRYRLSKSHKTIDLRFSLWLVYLTLSKRCIKVLSQLTLDFGSINLMCSAPSQSQLSPPTRDTQKCSHRSYINFIVIESHCDLININNDSINHRLCIIVTKLGSMRSCLIIDFYEICGPRVQSPSSRFYKLYKSLHSESITWITSHESVTASLHSNLWKLRFYHTSILRHIVSSTLLNRIALRSCHTKLWVTSWHRLYKIWHTAFFDHTKLWITCRDINFIKFDALRFGHTKLGVTLSQQSSRRSVMSTTP